MKVSIIIPTYNYGHYLPECFRNLQDQTYPNWEALVVDDGSQDGTRQVCLHWQEKEPRIKYIYQENAGVSKARNLGISKCTGDFIQFLDADDLISPEKIELQLDLFQAYPDIDLIYTENYYFPDGEPHIRYPDQEFSGRDWLRRFSGSRTYALDNLIQNNLAVVSSPLLRRSLLNKAGYFPTDIAHTEDWQFWFQCVLAGANIRFLPNPKACTLIRVHHQSVSQNIQHMQYGELNLRNWLNGKIENCDFLNPEEKDRLIELNEARKKLLVKHIMYHGPLNSTSHLKEMAKLIDWPTAIWYYIKALNFKRRSSRKSHAKHRYNHTVQRTK